MATVSVAKASIDFLDLISRVEAGETIELEQHGKLVARLTPANSAGRPVDVERLAAVVNGGTQQPVDAGSFIRKMRDQDRY